MNATMTMNNAKQGIEIRFDGKPDGSIIGSLKDNGFRWSPKQKMWYAKQSEDRLAFAATLDGIEIEEIPDQPTASAEPEIFDLWAATRTENIGDNRQSLNGCICNKDIASIFRKHIKERFPFCKWAIRSSIHSINITLLCSPFERSSEENMAIINYVKAYTESFNYDNSDPYTDYFDVGFYCFVEVDYNMNQTDCSDAAAISEKFKFSKAGYEAAEQERRAIEIEEQDRQHEQEEADYRKRRDVIAEQVVRVESNAKIIDIPEENQYFIRNLIAPRLNKCCSEEMVRQEIENDYYFEDCKISREIRLSAEDYFIFSNMLLEDYSFLSGMGGSTTDDSRVESWEDLRKMAPEEKETVKWYNVKCIAVFREGELKLVIDPQGHNYARYTFIPHKTTIIEGREQSMKLTELELLAILENLRIIKGEDDDYILRLVSGIVAEYFGYSNRADWSGEVRRVGLVKNDGLYDDYDAAKVNYEKLLNKLKAV